MNAMILAAGRGERMRPLSDRCPKPLLRVGGQTLLDWHLARLDAAGFDRVVINTAWLGDMIRDHVARQAPAGLDVRLSDEGERGLETAGGIVRALPLLGPDPFAVINGDVWSDFDPAWLPARPEGLGYLVLVDNPDHHPGGDFRFDGHAVLPDSANTPRYTFAGIACYHPELFAGVSPDVVPLAPILRRACERRQLTGFHHEGQWCDVGTPARLAALDMHLSRR